MKKKKQTFICNKCKNITSKWFGQCPSCGEWDTVEESAVRCRDHLAAPAPRPLNDKTLSDIQRLNTTISELDRVLGGGIVPGSLVLIGGDPGIGKSTLILQILAALAETGHKVLYATGEESHRQVQLRARRLGADLPDIWLMQETCVETVVETASRMQPALLAVDSIQTMHCREASSLPGSVTQVRESAARLLELAKTADLPVLLVGHVTKDGSIAGPRVLEHMVDTVLYFEGDRGQMFRILRTVKNRFGSTNEIGVFTMEEEGLAEVSNPSALFLAERPVNVPGSVVMASMEGSRPILVEVQALVSPSSGGAGRRTAIGADPQRLALLTAVLEKKLGISLFDQDIFLNIAGGIRIEEPALDLGVVTALLSSLFEQVVDPGIVVCGEVGLAGEIRAAGQMVQRLREAARLGFTSFVMPATCLKHLDTCPETIHVLGPSSIRDLSSMLFSR